jgi:hypothetical protein
MFWYRDQRRNDDHGRTKNLSRILEFIYLWKRSLDSCKRPTVVSDP